MQQGAAPAFEGRQIQSFVGCQMRRSYRNCGLLLASAARNSILIAAMESAAAAALSARGSRGGEIDRLNDDDERCSPPLCSPHNKSRIQEDAGAAPYEHTKYLYASAPAGRTSPAGVPLIARTAAIPFFRRLAGRQHHQSDLRQPQAANAVGRRCRRPRTRKNGASSLLGPLGSSRRASRRVEAEGDGSAPNDVYRSR